MDWLLDSEVTYLNHGAYGACPRPVFERYQAWQQELEHEPTDLLYRRLPGLLGEVRAVLGDFLGAGRRISCWRGTPPRRSTRPSARYG